jgi:hypothetical protein
MLTSNLELENKEKQKEATWTSRQLLPFRAMVSAIQKTIINLFDVLLVFLAIVLSIVELIGRDISIGIWLFTFLILVCDIVDRRIWEPKPKEEVKK